MTNNNHEPSEPQPDGTSGDIAVIGESSNSKAISLQTLQGIYNELTGKSEEVGKSYSKPIQVKFADIEQLDHKISQACEQYNVVSGNCSINVYYIDDTRDRFSSFERFRMHNAGCTSPVESILLKYNFLILLPKTKQPQSYSITIRLASRVAVMRRMEGEFYGPPPQIIRLMGNRTAVVEVEYIDYMVARNLLNIVDEWFKVIPTANEFKWLNWLRYRSHHIPKLARFFTGVIVGLIIITLLPKFIPSGSTDLLAYGLFSAWAMLGAFATYRMAGFFATLIEGAIDQWSEISYVCITKGDELEISNAEQKNRFAIMKGVAGFVFTVLLSIATKIIATLLTS
ncbi:MAG: hypothetical protein M0P59_13060 [Gallionella sp.]|jgi:hypothetical protein|nr:hypothetical protein [Gallionella sp.]MCK9355066.1 hypothetical protein [Gallionella sp.]